MSYELRTVDRTLDLLDVLADEAPLRLSDLTVRLNTNQTTVLRTLRVLERHGYVRRSPGGAEYSLGTRLIELGLVAVSGIDVPNALRPLGTHLAREFGANVYVGMLREAMITVIAKFDSAKSRGGYSTLGTRMPMHATAGGKAALAVTGGAGIDDLGLAAPLHRYTPTTFLDLDSLRRDVADTVVRRFSVDNEEHRLGYSCVGSAFRLDGEVYTISISGPSVASADLARRGEALRASMDEFLEAYRGAALGIGAPAESVAQ